MLHLWHSIVTLSWWLYLPASFSVSVTVFSNVWCNNMQFRQMPQLAPTTVKSLTDWLTVMPQTITYRQGTKAVSVLQVSTLQPGYLQEPTSHQQVYMWIHIRVSCLHRKAGSLLPLAQQVLREPRPCCLWKPGLDNVRIVLFDCHVWIL